MAVFLRRHVYNVVISGSIPETGLPRAFRVGAVLAQLVERKALNLVVQGSSPWGGDTCPLYFLSFFPRSFFNFT
jgi:hypothetical protein